MLNQLVHNFNRTARVIYFRSDHTPILIPPILYHGTNSSYLEKNTRWGTYTKPGNYSPQICTVASSLGAIQRAKDDARFYPQDQPSIPILLVINTLASVDDTSRDKKNTPEMVFFDRLHESNYEALYLVCPEDKDFWNLEKILEMNRDGIESAIQRLLGLSRRVSMESIHSQDLTYKGWHSADSD